LAHVEEAAEAFPRLFLLRLLAVGFMFATYGCDYGTKD